MGWASSEVQISESETPLHRLETVYRRLIERLATADTPLGAQLRVVTMPASAAQRTLYYGSREKLLEGGREALAGKEERQGERSCVPVAQSRRRPELLDGRPALFAT